MNLAICSIGVPRSLFTVRPLSAELMMPMAPLEAGKVQQIQCRTTGANPSAFITWWYGLRQITDADNQVSRPYGTFHIVRVHSPKKMSSYFVSYHIKRSSMWLLRHLPGPTKIHAHSFSFNSASIRIDVILEPTTSFTSPFSMYCSWSRCYEHRY